MSGVPVDKLVCTLCVVSWALRGPGIADVYNMHMVGLGYTTQNRISSGCSRARIAIANVSEWCGRIAFGIDNDIRGAGGHDVWLDAVRAPPVLGRL